jgi:hypothetical protein
MIKEFNDPRTGWAMGTYGGIAEWMWDPRIDANAKFILQSKKVSKSTSPLLTHCITRKLWTYCDLRSRCIADQVRHR